jgi:phosphoribosylaminoimidazole carboxylase (NCAIR synthetase)
MSREKKREYDRARYRKMRNAETCAEKGKRCVYLIRTCGYEADGKTWVKLGVAKNPELRRQKLQCGCPLDLELLHYVEVPTEVSLMVEKALRGEFNSFHARGEWLLISWGEGYEIRDAMEKIADEVQNA